MYKIIFAQIYANYPSSFIRSRGHRPFDIYICPVRSLTRLPTDVGRLGLRNFPYSRLPGWKNKPQIVLIAYICHPAATRCAGAVKKYRNMEKLYPLTFSPIFKDKIWGGDKINTILGKEYPGLPNCGETWEISAVPGNVSRVDRGPLKGRMLDSLVSEYGAALTGGKIYRRYGNSFPLLVKFISAADDLSIQVHPDDSSAMARHNCPGKTEMWYVMDADSGSTLISGFKRETTREEYLRYFESGHLTDLLMTVPVKKGDCFYIPTGRVHSIGSGILLAEIQQSSDITYRIYDYDRTDFSGQKRELHVEQALDVIDFSAAGDPRVKYSPVGQGCARMVSSPYFETSVICACDTLELSYSDAGDSFVIYTCVEGSFTLETDGNEPVRSKAGECILIPASVSHVRIVPDEPVRILQTTAQ